MAKNDKRIPLKSLFRISHKTSEKKIMVTKSRVLKLRENEEYYSLARKGSLDLSHPWIKLLGEYSKDARNILDIGCGEGTRLASFLKPGQLATGVDISPTAIDLAKKQHKDIRFVCIKENSLPLNNEEFDLVYSAFVLEHTTNPETFLNEGSRVLKNKGVLLMVAPNFGAPNRRSPNSIENPLTKLVKGILGDLMNHDARLNWKFVEPRSDTYTMDADTTVEPYLLTLKKFLQHIGLSVESYSSCWNLDKVSVTQSLFRLLGVLRVYPFKYWGPHLVIAARKIK